MSELSKRYTKLGLRKTKPALWVTIRKTGREIRQPVKERNKEYAIKRRRFLQRNRHCVVFRDRPSSQIHHIRGRLGPLLLDERYWLAVSWEGHRWIHDNPAIARKRGWIAGQGQWNNNEI